MRSLVLFRIVGETPEKPCVFKLEIGKKFFIWKSPGLVKSLKSMAKDLDRKIQGQCAETDLFVLMVKHMRSYKMYEVRVIPLFSSEKINEILDFEAKQLELAKGNDDCVNVLFEPYKPSWVTGIKNEPISRAVIQDQPKTKAVVFEAPKAPKKDVIPEEIDEKIEFVKPTAESFDGNTKTSFISGEEIPDFSDIQAMLKSIKK